MTGKGTGVLEDGIERVTGMVMMALKEAPRCLWVCESPQRLTVSRPREWEVEVNGEAQLLGALLV